MGTKLGGVEDGWEERLKKGKKEEGDRERQTKKGKGVKMARSQLALPVPKGPCAM